MDNTLIKLPPRMASSYVWNKGTINNKYFAVKCYETVVAFVLASFGKYTVSEADVVSVNKQRAYKKLSREVKCCGLEKRAIIENHSNASEDMASPAQKNDALLDMSENIIKNDTPEAFLKPVCIGVPENIIKYDTPEAFSIPICIGVPENIMKYDTPEAFLKPICIGVPKNIIKYDTPEDFLIPICVSLPEYSINTYTPNDFLALIREGKFSKKVHYVVQGSLDLTRRRDDGLVLILPERLTVNGHASFSYQNRLLNLPKELIVKGNLDLTGCEGLEDLSNSRLLVYGFLNCNGCINMTSAPNELTVLSGVDFVNCFSLVKLPGSSYSSLKGRILLENCYAIETLPNDFIIDGDFVVVNCNGLKGSHNGLTVSGHNSLEQSKKRIESDNNGVNKVESQFKINNSLVDSFGRGYQFYSPEDFIKIMGNTAFLSDVHYVVTGSLSSRSFNNEGSIVLPDNLTVMGNVHFSERRRRMIFPKEFIVKGHLTLNCCLNIIDMSQSSFSVGGSLRVLNCKFIEKAPKELHVAYSIYFMGCNYLAKLPNGLIVKRDLIITDSSHIAIPNQLNVHGNLLLTRCDAIEMLPMCLILGGLLSIKECGELKFSLMRLPRGIAVYRGDPDEFWDALGYI